MKGEIVYFDEPGPQNTDAVLEIVKNRLKEKDIGYVVVASESGSTALRVAKVLKDTGVKIACVAPYAGYQRALGRKWPAINGDRRQELERVGVKILEETQWIFGCTFDTMFIGDTAPSIAIHKFVSRAFGFGVKTCIEIALIAAEAGAVPSDEEIIAVAGTGWLGGGADAAIVIKPCHIHGVKGGDFLKIDKGVEVREIIAMPRVKFSQKLIDEMKKEGRDEPI